MRNVRLWAALLVLLFFANQGWAQGTITWDSCPAYPQPGNKAGHIDVKGTFSLDCGWSLVGSTCTIRAWQDGLELKTITGTISCNTFSGTINVDSAQSYNVTVEIDLIDACEVTATIVTDPGKTTTK